MSAAAPPPETDEERQEIVRVSTLELFFDLVFVLAITQLTAQVEHHPDAKTFFQVAVMLGVMFWMYGGYAWLTNAVSADTALRRGILLGGMAAFLVVSLAIPQAWHGGGAAFGIGYALIVLVHLGLFSRATSSRTVSSVLSLAPFNLLSGALVLAGGVVGGTAQYVLWTAAFVLEWITPWLFDPGGFSIGASHFVERHGLVVIVAIGESIVAVGAGVGERAVTLELALIAVLGLALSTLLWWTYFGGDVERAEAVLAAAPPERQPKLAVTAWGHAHVVLLLAIVAVAAGQHQVLAHPGDVLATGFAVALGGGLALYLAGDLGFRALLGLERSPWRAGAAVLAALSIPIGTQVSAAAQLGVLVAALGVALTLELRAPGGRPAPAPG